MRILHINNTYGLKGGAEVYIKSLIELFNSHGHESYLFAIDSIKEFEDSSVCVYRDHFKRGPLKYFLWYYFNPMLYIRLRNWIKKIKPDIIHVHNNMCFTFTILLALKNSNIPVIQTVHDHSILCPSKLFIKSTGEFCYNSFSITCVKNNCIPLTRYLYQRVPEYLIQYLLKIEINIFIVPSIVLKDRLVKNGFSNVIYLPNFVDTSNFYYIPSERMPGLILYVGRLSDEKGIKYLIEAIPKVIKKYPDCKLNIVGDGPSKNSLQKLIKDLNLENYAIFNGKVSDQDLKLLYQKSNVVIIPSIWMENSPIVAYEAMASGTPIIGSNVGGIPDLIIDKKTGFIVNPRNSDDIAKKIIEILSNSELSLAMGKLARETCVNKYDSSIFYNKLLCIYTYYIKK